MRRLGLFPTSCVASSASTSCFFSLQQEQPKQQTFPVVIPQFDNSNFNIIVNSSSNNSNNDSSSPSFSSLFAATTPTVVNAQRFLRVAKSPIGYHIRRRGQFANHWPRYRKPHNVNPGSAVIVPIMHWRRFGPYDPNQFLPASNYVTGPWVGLTYSHLHQVYTLQHCNAGVPLRVRRFPTIFEFKSHSRWMIGKALRTWVEPRAHIFDEAALTKKARLDLVKKGLVAPGG